MDIHSGVGSKDVTLFVLDFFGEHAFARLLKLVHAELTAEGVTST